MNPRCLLAILLLLHAPCVLSCVNFYAVQTVENIVTGGLVDNNVEVCSILNSPSNGSGGTYVFSCNAGYALTFDPTNDNVVYNTPHGTFPFAPQYTNVSPPPSVVWQASVLCS